MYLSFLNRYSGYQFQSTVLPGVPGYTHETHIIQIIHSYTKINSLSVKRLK